MADGQPMKPGANTVSSWLSGNAREVVQARDISGGIHIHSADPSPLPRPRQLPAEVSAFVGRRREFELLQSWVRGGGGAGTAAGGSVLIVGTAGVGKTSLAVGFAHRIRNDFPDGQLFVNLRGYDPGPPLSSAAALERFLRALGVPLGAIPVDLEERAELYRTLLADHRILIVLDNAATVGQVRPLLPGEPGCLVLVTTRGRLSGLSAREGTHRISLGLLDQAEAVALVEETTAPYRDPDPPEQVSELVALCARLPLALRIVAERAAVRPHMPLRELISDLRRESSLWDALSAEDSADPDTDAVRSVFAWSYRALPPAAAKAFRRLGLHPGPEFGSGAAAAVVGDDLKRTRGLLDILVGGHLLEQVGPDRYQFHDLLRAYALSQVHSDESPEERALVLKRVIRWYLYGASAAVAATQTLIEPVAVEPPEATLEIPSFDSTTLATEWYAAERANLIAAVRVAAESGFYALAWQISATLYPIQDAYGSLDDWIDTSSQGLESALAAGDLAGQASLLYSLGAALSGARELEQAEPRLAEAVRLFTELNDRNGLLRATNALGLVNLRRRRFDEAESMFIRCISLAEEGEHYAWRATALDNLGSAYDAMGGRPQEAAELSLEALQQLRSIDADPRTLLDPLLTLARIARDVGDLAQAEAHVNEAAEIIGSGVVFRSLAFAVLLEQAVQALLHGRNDQAMETYFRCLAMAREIGDRTREALAQDGIGRVLQATNRAAEAVEFYRVAATSGHPNVFEKASILHHLADALEATAQADAANNVRLQALKLLEPFTDKRSADLRNRLS